MSVSITAAAAAAMVTGGLSLAACSGSAGHTSAPAGAETSASAPPLRRLAAVNQVELAQLDRHLAHLLPGHVVLDLRALESLEAAEDLTLHWRSTHPPGAELVCWLRPDGDNAALANAVKTLSMAGCSVLNVALESTRRAGPTTPQP
jgi:hypothetical protein